MSEVQFLLATVSQSLGGANGVLNLTTIELFADQRAPLPVRDIIHSADFAQEGPPDLLTRAGIEIFVSQGYVDSALERIIEGGNPIGREEENAGEIFELTQEHGDQGIALNVVNGTLFEEDVRLVNEHDSIPGMCNIEDLVERAVKVASGRAQVTSTNDIQRFSEV